MSRHPYTPFETEICEKVIAEKILVVAGQYKAEINSKQALLDRFNTHFETSISMTTFDKWLNLSKITLTKSFDIKLASHPKKTYPRMSEPTLDPDVDRDILTAISHVVSGTGTPNDPPTDPSLR